MELVNRDEYILSTGKKIMPHKGIIGLTEEGGEFKIYEGYDGSWIAENEIKGTGYTKDDIELTNEELKEIALYMSELWRKFASEL